MIEGLIIGFFIGGVFGFFITAILVGGSKDYYTVDDSIYKVDKGKKNED